jgi:hypothetical protein
VSHCQKVLSDARAFDPQSAAAFLSASAVRTLLVPFAQVLCLATSRLWLAAALLPSLVRLTAALQAAARDLCDVERLERALHRKQVQATKLQAEMNTNFGLSFDPTLMALPIELSDGGRTATSTRENEDHAIALRLPDGKSMAAGRHAWVVRIDQKGGMGDQTGLGVGVVRSNWGTGQELHSYLGSSENSWGLECTGHVFHLGPHGQQPEMNYGMRFNQGDEIGVMLDFDEVGPEGAGTLSFSCNGKMHGPAFSGLSGRQLLPAVWFYCAGDRISIVSYKGSADDGGGSVQKGAGGSSAEMAALASTATLWGTNTKAADGSAAQPMRFLATRADSGLGLSGNNGTVAVVERETYRGRDLPGARSPRHCGAPRWRAPRGPALTRASRASASPRRTARRTRGRWWSARWRRHTTSRSD